MGAVRCSSCCYNAYHKEMYIIKSFRNLRFCVNHIHRWSRIQGFHASYTPLDLHPARCVRYSTESRPSDHFDKERCATHSQLGTFYLCGNTPNHLLAKSRDAISYSLDIVSRLFERSQREKLKARTLVYAIDEISNVLCSIADPCELLRHVHPSEEWRNAANTIVEDISSLISRLNIDEELYKIMNDAYTESRDSLNQEEALVFNHMIESMRHQGVGLPPSDKDAYLNLQREEALIAFELSDSSIMKHLAVDSIYGRRVPPNPALYAYILRNSPDEQTRRVIWEAQSQCHPEILDKLLHLRNIRHSIARTRRFNNYAECAQRECIMNNPQEVEKFLQQCTLSLKEDVMRDLSELREMKAALKLKDSNLRPWDMDYLIGSHRDKLSVNFKVSSVLRYFQQLLYDLFGITMIRDEREPLWHPLVAKFILLRHKDSETGIIKFGSINQENFSLLSELATNKDHSGYEEVAHLYMDLFAREDKATVCAQFTVRCSKLLHNADKMERNDWKYGTYVMSKESLHYVTAGFDDGSVRQIPATTIVCSYPLDQVYSDITHALENVYIDAMAAQTLFHELGHTVHALCSRTDLQHLSGNRGGVDFAEFSSHLFEIYFVDGLPDICKIEGMGTESVEKASQLFRKYQAIDTARMTLMALIDLKFYNSSEKLNMASVQDLVKSVRLFDETFDGHDVSELLGMPAITNFEHLIHYGATYFCYLYSRYVKNMIAFMQL